MQSPGQVMFTTDKFPRFQSLLRRLPAVGRHELPGVSPLALTCLRVELLRSHLSNQPLSYVVYVC